MLETIIKRIRGRIRATFFPTIQDRELQRWCRENPAQEKRFEYPLSRDSIVIDLGGYDGQWASDIYSRYRCSVFVFEAVPAFAEKISHRFEGNSAIRVHPIAIGKESRADRIFLNDRGSSLYVKKDKGIDVQVRDAARLFELCDVAHCQLLKINIEGGEYEVLPRLIESGLIARIDNLQIQFHNFGPSSHSQMETIQSNLIKTHTPTWQYTWVWENWKCKQD